MHHHSSSSLPVLPLPSAQSMPNAPLLYEGEQSLPARAILPKLLWRVLIGYVLLLLLLVPLGVYNRHLYQQEWELIQYKEGLQDSMADLRIAEASIRGPERVRAWALEHGMVPSAEVDDVHYTPYILKAEPQILPEVTQVELVNTWH